MLMNLKDRVGGLFVYGFAGSEASEDVLSHLRRIHAQSLIVFDHNFTSPDQFTRLIRNLEEALQRKLLVMVDHEGGRVFHMRNGLTHFPSARIAASANDVSAIEHQGMTEAKELKPLGIRVNLSPCVDVVVPGSDPIIGDRSYGDNPEMVSAFSRARIQGLQNHGLAACAKHFPGLGAVELDPHKRLPTIRLDHSEWGRSHRPPFVASIQADVSMIMSSHVCFPNLGDPEGLPATFSRRIISKILRDELGFKGLALSDDMKMGALATFGSMGTCAEKAIRAGHDLLLICSDPEAQREAFDHICNLLYNNELYESTIEESSARMAKLWKKWP